MGFSSKPMVLRSTKMCRESVVTSSMRMALAICLACAFLLESQLAVLENQRDFFAKTRQNNGPTQIKAPTWTRKDAENVPRYLLEQQEPEPLLSHGNVDRISADDNRNNSAPDVYRVSPLTPLDYEKYTVRVNTWKRQTQLKLVLKHLQTCKSVAQIQVVWCTAQGAVTDWLRRMDHKKIVVEEHEDNSLNARFDLLSTPPTAGILNQDDDILRPCEAMDAGFALWTLDPDRMVGFDARSHAMVNPDDNERWSYSYLSSTTTTNRYSLSLTRFCFLHRDYLQQYTTKMPSVMRERVAQHLNCEDIAMSFWVSAQTHGQPPLLADVWAMNSAIKLEEGEHAISGSSGHKQVRDACVNDFAELLGLKTGDEALKPTKWLHGKNRQNLLQSGIHGTDPRNAIIKGGPLKTLLKQREEWGSCGVDEMKQVVGDMKIRAIEAIRSK